MDIRLIAAGAGRSSKETTALKTHPDFGAREDRDCRCERKIKNGLCPNKAKGLYSITALGGYPAFSVALCTRHGREAEQSYYARKI